MSVGVSLATPPSVGVTLSGLPVSATAARCAAMLPPAESVAAPPLPHAEASTGTRQSVSAYIRDVCDICDLHVGNTASHAHATCRTHAGSRANPRIDYAQP